MTTDNQVVTGLGDDTTKGAGAAAAPETEKVTIDGKEVTVDKAVATALRAAQDAATKSDAAKSAAETQLREALEKGKQPAPKAAAADDDIETLLFTNPKRAAQLIIEAATATIRQETALSTAQQQFWTDFYTDNPELKDADLVVRAVMGREHANLAPLKVAEARAKLAEASKKELLRLGATTKPGKQPAVGEGGTNRGTPPSKEGKVSGDSPASGGLSAVLKDRAAARKAGGGKSASA